MADISVSYDPISINSGPVTVDVQGLNDISAKLTVEKPIQTDSKFALTTIDTVKTDSKFALTSIDTVKTDSKVDTASSIDLKPVAVDQCLRLSLAPLPATRICFPNQQKIGLTLFGVEVFGLTFNGGSEILVGEAHKQPRWISGEVHAGHEHREPHQTEIVADGASVKIRLGG